MQIQLVIRDMLFINYAVEPERLRGLVPEQFALDITLNQSGREVAFVSAVSFRNVEVSSTLLPRPRLSFDQINYRAYVVVDEVPSVYFLDMKVNSRLIATGTGLLGAPTSYEEIEIATAPADSVSAAGTADVGSGPPAPNTLRYIARSEGPHPLVAEVTIGGRHESVGPEGEAIATEFITERPVGYVSAAAESIFKIEVEHPKLEAVSAHVEQVRAEMLEYLGLLSMDESRRPHSVLYVREATFNSNPPMPWMT